MKRFWKIFGITLGTLLIALLIAISVVINFVFTSDRLTPVVRNLADEYVLDSCEIGKVELTLFSTFPEFGLRVEDLQIGEWLNVNELVATVDVYKFLKENTLDIHCLRLTDVDVTLIQDTAGNWNFDVFAFSSDSTEEDTTAFSLPFENLTIDKIDLNLRSAVVYMQPDSIFAELGKTRLQAAARSWNDIDLSLESQELTATIGEEQYANAMPISIHTQHAALDLEAMRVVLQETKLQLADYAFTVAGEVQAKDNICVNLQVLTEDWEIVPLLQLVPNSFTTLLDGIDITGGAISLDAHIHGTLNSDQLPLIDAKLALKNASGAYKSLLPYDLKRIDLQAVAQLNLNDSLQNSIQIESLSAYLPTGMKITATGEITKLLADMDCNLQVALNGKLQELQPLIKQMELPLTGTGKFNLQADIRSRLSDLTDYDIPRANLRGTLKFNDLDANYDSILVRSSNGVLTFQMPYSTSPVIKLTANMQAGDLEAVMDSMGAKIQTLDLAAEIEYDTQDTTQIPVLNATIAFDDLQAYYDDMQAHLTKSNATASLQGGRRDKTQPRLGASIETQSLQAFVGNDIAVQTEHFVLSANARRNPKEENLLLQWNPRLSIQLQNGEAHLTEFKEVIYIPSIDFSYSNRKCEIRQSQILVGHSDFSLTGQVENIGKWLRKKEMLVGELTFTSSHTDANELLALCSAKDESNATENTVEVEEQTSANEDKQPFLVPTDVDLVLNTKIDEAIFQDQIAREIGGRVYVRDTALILEEMGFICKAARLQLTAMYKTRYANHLYLGIDCHMLDIQIDELIDLIPQVDSVFPMLRSFGGDAEFHLAAETYMNSRYELKKSTMLGACAITGKNLTLKYTDEFGKIAKLLLFNKEETVTVDSINVEATLRKEEITVYPFCINIENYMVAIGGWHDLDMQMGYDINALKPIYLGVHVGGTLDDLDIKLAKCVYAEDFRPRWGGKVDEQKAALRRRILESMQRNVKQ